MVRSAGTLFVAALVITAASGCGAFGRHAGTRTDTPTTEAAATTSAAAEVPLYQQFESGQSGIPNGESVNANLAGTFYPNSTGMWVGCEGTAVTSIYRLGHKFSRLRATAGLQPHTPDGLTVDVTISGDSRSLQHFVLAKQNPVPIDLDVTGIDSLVVAATAVDKSLCASANTPYGALGSAVLSEVAS